MPNTKQKQQDSGKPVPPDAEDNGKESVTDDSSVVSSFVVYDLPIAEDVRG
jgi:hypothetical protein